MSAHASSARLPLRNIVVRVFHPPLHDPAFWVVQGMVVIWAIVHIEADLHSFANGIMPTGAPIDPLLIPVGYAALRYGLSGAAATAVWAGLLWLPDLLLSDNQGHPDQDLIQITVVIAVALFVGLEIERAHLEQERAEAAEAERRAAELHYHQLFETNASPILLVDPDGVVAEANAAAAALWGRTVGSTSERLLGKRGEDIAEGRSPETVRLQTQTGEERDYRLSVSRLGADADGSLRQLVLEDVTEEYLAGSQARAWAGEVLRAQEEERRRIAREIHDDPLQRLLQLARRMEALSSPGHPADGVDRLSAARDELLDVIGHLRDVTRTLHPAGLDQLGLVAAVRGMLADVEATEGLTTELAVTGEVERGTPEAEVGVFRITQEAVRNVIRHADAHRLRVELAYKDGVVRMTVADDGRGFDQAATGPGVGRHLGTLGMRERASLLDGRCEVLSTPGDGTLVTATVPLQRTPLAVYA
ncbi:MAG TPA: sensor histidine kinase [Gaiellaceae bacterium]|nr:sensor histidine kinase [Gaiellaceae bacterium]